MPRLKWMSYGFGSQGLLNVTLPEEEMSIFLDQVKLLCAWSPCDMRFSSCSCREW